MLLGFKKQFIEPIQIGTKIFTLRSRRKKMPKIGEQLYMYSGLRTKYCQKISDKEKLMGIQNVRIAINKEAHNRFTIKIQVDGRFLSFTEMVHFARYDGFVDIKAWADYWLGKKSRTGALRVMFHWTDFKY